MSEIWPTQRVRDLLWCGADDRALRRDVERGRVHRVSPGVYIDADVWSAMQRDERYLLRIAAIAGTRRSAAVFSHYSAAALLGYPVIGDWPTRVHTLVGERSGQRNSPYVARHSAAVKQAEIIELGGILLTNPLRTLTDLARDATAESAVAAIDRALAGSPPSLSAQNSIEREALRESIERLGQAPGTRRAKFAIDFADGKSGSPGESVSRVQMHRLHNPKPQLQVRVYIDGGTYFDMDFGWKEFDAFAEFDGLGKYFKPEYVNGRTPQQVLRDEKARENTVRAITGWTFARWDWAVALDAPALRACLLNAGVRSTSTRR